MHDTPYAPFAILFENSFDLLGLRQITNDGFNLRAVDVLLCWLLRQSILGDLGNARKRRREGIVAIIYGDNFVTPSLLQAVDYMRS